MEKIANLTKGIKSKCNGASESIVNHIMHNGLSKYAVYDIRLNGNRHLALNILFTIPPLLVEHATRIHATPIDHVVLPRPV